MPDAGFHIVAVVGAGPTGLFASRELTANEVHVVLFNQDIKPGGLAEYGIYHDKHRLKDGLRKQFNLILDCERLDYYGMVKIGRNGDLCLDDLQKMGFQAVLIAVGAQGTRWLGIPGEHLRGVYHAKDVVYHYNLLPPYATRDYQIGKRVAIIGAGNVMTDLARYLIDDHQVDEVIAIARRGPAEIKFDKKELELVAANMDMQDIDAQIDAAAPLMRSLGQDPEAARKFLHETHAHKNEQTSQTRFTMQFLLSPVQILDDGLGNVAGLEVEKNTLILSGGQTKARGTGERFVLPVDTVLFAVGDRVDENLGVPVHGFEYFMNPEPAYPVEGVSYEVYDPQKNAAMTGYFAAGWARLPSTGLVGVSKKDGVNAARAVMAYLADKPLVTEDILGQIRERMCSLDHVVTDKEALRRLIEFEKAHGEANDLIGYKCCTNEEMLAIMGLQGCAEKPSAMQE